MPAKIGTVNKVKRLFGWDGDWEVQIEGESFYKRLGIEGKKPNCVVGMRVRLEYEEKTTKLFDWVGDRVCGLSYVIPQKYREIIKIECSP